MPEGIEVRRPLEGGLRGAHAVDPVDAEGAQALAQVAMAHHVPAAPAVGQAVGIELALGERGLGRAIDEVHAPSRLRGRASAARAAPSAERGLARKVERHRVVRRAHAPPQVRRHHALELGLRARHAGRGAGQAEAARGQESHRQGQRLLVREHHRRQLVAGDQHVAAVAAVLDRDRNAEVLEPRDVAPQGAAVHAQAGGELRSAQAAVGLQQLEGGEDPRGGVVHARMLAGN